ncbi:MAG: NADH-quinone oxidoreductase subunit C [Bacteroidetes bacterium]|nr:NADH-quinone oxidoreductase subunit C [Bacteroidota bacterium]
MNNDLRRLLLDYGFNGYPLHKNFPITGYIELYYDDVIKKIAYDNVDLNLEYRIFFN